MDLEFKKTKTNNMKQLLYFSATWCQPCKQFKPLMESLQSEMSITFIDVEISSQTAIQHNVRSVPTTILIENGMEKGRLVGVKSVHEVRDLYNR
jgi:thioredoxin-like negative regulator of GroEL